MKYDDIICQRIYNRAMKDLNDSKYLYTDMLLGCLIHVFRQARVPTNNPIPEQYIETFIDALHDSFYGGCEPEHETEEQYHKYENSLKMLREDLVFSTPRYSAQLNKFLFPNGAYTYPTVCRLSKVTERIQRLHEQQNDKSTWGRDSRSMHDLYNEFYGYTK